MKEEIHPIITYKVNVFMFNIRTMTEYNSITVQNCVRQKVCSACVSVCVCVCVCE